MSHFRWLAIVKYRTNAGVNEVDHQFEELFELQDLIERARIGIASKAFTSS